MINQKRLDKYAELAIVKGVNLQKGQILMLHASVEAQPFIRACVKSAYAHGAKHVQVYYKDDDIERMEFEYEEIESLTEIKQWQIDSKLDYLKEGACKLIILSEIPGIMKGLDADKIAKQRLALANACKEEQAYTMENKTQWCIVANPNPAWATLVYPDIENEDKAVIKLWDQIFSSVHVGDDNDPIEAWTQLNKAFQKHVEIMNTYAFDVLHFTNELGTDLEVKLVDQHIWAGGSEFTTDTNIEFNPNMPTEEIFTMPHCRGVNGRVYASKPLVYNGSLIKDFWLDFKDGEVIDFDASEGKDALHSLIHFDEGSRRLGEVALVPYDSPISQSNVLFYNTLFDENASCHLALGNCYASNVKNGLQMNKDQLNEVGANHSFTHVDFMFGTQDLQVMGICHDGKQVPVFKNGNFVI